MNEWEPVIGLEVHVQLKTRTKLFCGDAVSFGAEPNSNVCPVCLGLPGALPVLNDAAVELAIRAALGLECMVHEVSIFARKNYFYPDLPKGYQITQFDRPIATNGSLPALDQGRVVPVHIRRIHMEEDAGKSIHDRLPGRTAIDLNRAGVPLVEIVTEPDIQSPAHARSYLAMLKQILQYIEVSDCDMEKGSLRVDANISMRPVGTSGLGVKTEVKNMNSFANVERALQYEIDRQTVLLQQGGTVVQQTLLWDANAGIARPMRSKEESHDYRYFPDPDLPALVIERSTIDRIRNELPELPAARRARFTRDYAVPEYDADVLTADKDVADYYEAVVRAGTDGKSASNWVMTDVLGSVKQEFDSIRSFPIPAGHLAELIAMVRSGAISHSTARQVFSRMITGGERAGQIVEREGLAQTRDTDQLAQWVQEIVSENTQEVQRYRAGDEKLLSFFMGQLMKRSKGKADPKLASELMRSALKGD